MKIELLGKVFDNHSLSIINRNLLKGLNARGVEVGVTPLDGYDPNNKLNVDDLEVLDDLSEKEIENPDIQLRHTYPAMWRWPRYENSKLVYIQPWEFSKIPFEWAYKWEQFADAIIVPSTWNGERVLDAGVNPKELFVVPNGYDPKVYNTEKEEDSIIQTNKFVFTYVGNGQYRKGIDILLECWATCFTKADNVVLYIKDTPAVYGQNNLLDEIIKLQYKSGCAEVIYNDEMFSEIEMANIYKNTDILIHPYRGEGFGMHVQEAMACGALPLVTGGGATNDFVNDQCGICIPSQQVAIDLTANHVFATKPGDSLTNMGQHSWILEPDRNAMINIMRTVYSHHDRPQVLDLVHNAKLNTWDAVVDRYIEVFEEILKNESGPKRFKK
jgi:glycosyltransferase involved in cell wall biosynthesis